MTGKLNWKSPAGMKPKYGSAHTAKIIFVLLKEVIFYKRLKKKILADKGNTEFDHLIAMFLGVISAMSVFFVSYILLGFKFGKYGCQNAYDHNAERVSKYPWMVKFIVVLSISAFLGTFFWYLDAW